MTLDRQQVRRDVGLVIRAVVIAKTVFDDVNYDPESVPAADPMDGWGATLPNWYYILGCIEATLHQLRLEYRVLTVEPNEAEQTLNNPLYEAADLLTAKIINKHTRLLRRRR